jgi:hypothetical protein
MAAASRTAILRIRPRLAGVRRFTRGARRPGSFATVG